jgi:hypothetical protein
MRIMFDFLRMQYAENFLYFTSYNIYAKKAGMIDDLSVLRIQSICQILKISCISYLRNFLHKFG